MLKKLTLCLTLVGGLFLLPTILMAQGNTSPFLITGKIPHLTKILMQQWDNSDLHLKPEQQKQLLIIRKETISGIQAIRPQIATLEQQVATDIAQGKTPESLHTVVQAIAKLKIKATMLHLKCTHDTREILSKQQMEILLSH